MPPTVIRGTQVLDGSIQRPDLDVTTAGKAVVAKLVQGSGITLSSTGADSGTGDVTVSSPDVVSTDAGNIATLGTDNHILVPQSQIWSTRLRSFNAVGNPTFEVTQRSCGTAISNPVHGTMIEDRWAAWNNGALNPSFQAIQAVTPLNLPGTSFGITKGYFRIINQTQKITLAGTDLVAYSQTVEGPQFRELANDVHSVSILCRSSVANLKFGLSIRDPGSTTKSLSKLCTLGAANTLTLVTLQNLPVFPSGNFSVAPGAAGYVLTVILACGSTFISPANDTWQNGNFPGAVGQDNFLGTAVSSSFDLAFVQHQPGPVCETPIDCPFMQAYDDALRYFAKSYDYGVKGPTNTGVGVVSAMTGSNASFALGTIPFPKTMAKTPTLTVYAVDGTANAVIQLGAGGNAAVNQILGLGIKGFYGVGFTSAVTANLPCQMHYIADTGW